MQNRKYNTNKQGETWSEADKKNVWVKGRVIPGFYHGIVRWDKCGKVIQYTAFGNREAAYGWEIDHIHPVAEGGDDEILNLQPLHWTNNAAKGDSVNWICPPMPVNEMPR